MANVIPMAGEGSRFSKEDYSVPKPLIPVSGVPMIVKAIRDMPESDKWIFLVRKEHIDEYQIDNVIKSEIKEAIIIPVEKTTEGQAATCMLAEEYLEEEEELFIAACDNGYLYDNRKFERLKKEADSVVFTLTKMETLRRNPQAWGWCILKDDNKTISDMSIKKPISTNPFNDHAIVASFYFKKAKYFFNGYELMVKENFRINNEFYVDAMPIFLNKLGKKSVIFDVDLYVGWGSPSDLKDYEKIENSNTVEKLWKKYFEK